VATARPTTPEFAELGHSRADFQKSSQKSEKFIEKSARHGYFYGYHAAFKRIFH
jgi:hypothetical protein